MSKSGKGKKTFTAWAALFLALAVGAVVTVSMASVAKTIQILLVAAVIVSVVVLVSGFMWARRNPTERKGLRRMLMALLSLGLVIVIGLDVAVYKYQVVVNQYLTKAKIDEEALAKASADSKAVTEQIEDEGIVLLENKEHALPLDMNNANEKNVNIFGQASVKMIYGGSGSGSGDESANVTIQQGLEKAGFKVNSELTEFYKAHAPAKRKRTRLTWTAATIRSANRLPAISARNC